MFSNQLVDNNKILELETAVEKLKKETRNLEEIISHKEGEIKKLLEPKPEPANSQPTISSDYTLQQENKKYIAQLEKEIQTLEQEYRTYKGTSQTYKEEMEQRLSKYEMKAVPSDSHKENNPNSSNVVQTLETNVKSLEKKIQELQKQNESYIHIFQSISSLIPAPLQREQKTESGDSLTECNQTK